MPTPRHGKNTRVFHGGYDLSPFLNNISIPRTVDTAETTAFGQTYKSYVLGEMDAKANASGMFSYNNAAPNADIDNIMGAALGQDPYYPITISFDSGVAAAGKAVIVGQMLNVGYAITAGVSAIVGVTADWQYSGACRNALTLNAVDTNISPAGANVTGTGVDCSALLVSGATQFLLGGMCVLHLFSNTNNGSAVVKIQSSATLGGTYVDLATFTSVATLGVSGQSIEIAKGTVVDKFLRYQIVTAGTGNMKMLATFAPSTV